MAKFTSDGEIHPNGLREDSTTQEYNLGAKATTTDGRVFRYCKVGGTALVAGKLYSAPASIANHTNLAVVSGAAGSNDIVVTLGGTAATKDQYAGGTIIINDMTGQGFTYSIKSNTAQTSTTGNVTVTTDDEEPVVTALDTTSEASLVPNQYNGIVVHATTEIAAPVGVANTQVTEAYYGWIQTRGPVSALCGATTGIGLAVAASDNTEGAVEVGDGILCPIGYQIAAGVTGEYNPVFLTID